MNEVPVREFVTRTMAVWVGSAVAFVGFACWILAVAGLLWALSPLNAPEAEYSTVPLITVTLGAIGTLGLAIGWKLVKGLPLHVPFTRRVLGVVLLLLAAIFMIASRHDSDVPWWIAAVLGVGGLISLLTWRTRVARTGM
jgi:hypothetical protein